MARRSWITLSLWGGGLISAFGFAGFVAGSLITDRLEQDNRFCVSCHAPTKASQYFGIKVDRIAKLHQEKYDGFYSRDGKVISLAGSHNVNRQVKCIDCHIGAGSQDYFIIKAIAARDTAKYVVGRYREPEGLTYALGDRTCLKCHRDGGQNLKNPKAFHNAPYHRDPRDACSDCHPSHVKAAAETRFIQQALVKPRCDSCHLEILGIKPR